MTSRYNAGPMPEDFECYADYVEAQEKYEAFLDETAEIRMEQQRGNF